MSRSSKSVRLLVVALTVLASLNAAFLFTAEPAPADRGLPDGWGYQWVDSLPPAPTVPYNWIDAQSGTKILSTDQTDGLVTYVSTPWGIWNYYGSLPGGMFVYVDGCVAPQGYDTPCDDTSVGPLPIPNAGDAMMPFLSSLDIPAGSNATYGIWTVTVGSPGSQQFVIEWRATYEGGAGGDVNFELVINETGEFWFQYNVMTYPASPPTYVAGLENWNSQIGNQWRMGTNDIVAGTAVRWDSPNYWPAFNQTSLSAWGYGGDTVAFPLTVWNTGVLPDTIDLQATGSWSTSFWNAGGTSPLADTNFNSLPDTGVLASRYNLGDNLAILVKVDIPPSGLGVFDSITVTATSEGDPTAVATANLRPHTPWAGNLVAGFESPTAFTHQHASPDEWQLGTPLDGPIGCHTGLTCWGTDLNGTYDIDHNGWLLSPAVDLGIFNAAYLRFWHWFDIEAPWPPASYDDGGWVEISVDGGSWTKMAPTSGFLYNETISWNAPSDAGGPVFAGMSNGWVQSEFDLSAYAGSVVQVRWWLWSDPWGSQGAGWYIDDVELVGLVEGVRFLPEDPPQLTAVAGGTARHALSVTNVGISSDIIDLFLNGTLPGWTYTWLDGAGSALPDSDLDTWPDTNYLLPGEGRIVLLDVTADPTALPGTLDAVTAIGVSTNNGSAQDSVVVPTLVPLVLPYLEGFEAGGNASLWQPGGPAGFTNEWEMGTPTDIFGCYDGSTCWGVDLDDVYENTHDGWVEAPAVDLQSAPSARLGFYHWVDVSGPPADGAFVEVSADGVTWEKAPIASGFDYNGIMTTSTASPYPGGRVFVGCCPGWVYSEIDLTPWVGGVLHSRFRLWGAWWGWSNGWYIDNVTFYVPVDSVDIRPSLPTEVPDRWTGFGDPGDSFRFPFNVTNRGGDSDIVNVYETGFSPFWSVIFYGPDGVTPLTDSNADFLNDVGSVAPGASVPIFVDVTLWATAPVCSADAMTILAESTDDISVSDTTQIKIYVLCSPGLWETFESASVKWEAGAGTPGAPNEWEWGTPTDGPLSCLSGTSCWGVDLDDTYDPSHDGWLSSPPVDLSGFSQAELRFWHWFDIEGDFPPTSYQDGGWLEARAGGGPWTKLAPTAGSLYNDRVQNAPVNPYGPVFAGQSGGWVESVVDLTAFTGGVVQVRWRLWDNTWTQYAGWYLDEVQLYGFAQGADLEPEGQVAVGQPGETVSLSISVQNIGVSTDTVDVIAGGVWPVTLFDAGGAPLTDTDGDTIPDAGPLAAGASVDIRADVAISALAMPGDSDDVTVTGISVANGSAMDAVLLRVFVGISQPYLESFTFPPSAWTTAGAVNEWEWGQVNYVDGPLYCMSPPRCWGTDLDGTYDLDHDGWLQTPWFDLRTADQAEVSFWHWFAAVGTSPPSSYEDGGRVEASADGLIWDWVPVTAGAPYNERDWDGWEVFGGDSNGWVQSTIDLSGFLGGPVALRFLFSDDGNTWPAPSVAAGWYIDDFEFSPVELPYGVDLQNNDARSGRAGDVVAYSGLAVNRGNNPDTIELSLSTGPQYWPTTLLDAGTLLPIADTNGDFNPDTGLLAPAQSFAFEAWVSIPSWAAPGDVDIATVSGVSVADAAATDSVAFRTRVQAFIVAPLNSPTVDGTITLQWGSEQADLGLVQSSSLSALLYVQADSTYLYVGVDSIGDPTPDTYDGVFFAADTGVVGTRDVPDSWFEAEASGWRGHWAYSPVGGWWSLEDNFDTGLPNHAGLACAIGFGSSPNSGANHRMYECQIPLALLGLSPGDTFGFGLEVWDDSGGWVEWPDLFWSAGTLATYGLVILDTVDAFPAVATPLNFLSPFEPGATDVEVLQVEVLPTGFGRIAQLNLQAASTGSLADFAQVNLWLDANNNSAVDGGDLWLDSVPAPPAAFVLVAFLTPLAPPNAANFLVTVNIAPTAQLSVQLDVTVTAVQPIFPDTAVLSGTPTGSIVVADLTPPASSVNTLPYLTTTATFPVPFTATDNLGTPVVDLYYRLNGGAFQLFGGGPFGSSPVAFTAPGDGFYEFYTIADDTRGNVEAAPATPDAYTIVDTTGISDTNPPAIAHTPVSGAFVGDAVEVLATITDDLGVQSATIWYQDVGSPTWVESLMTLVPPGTALNGDWRGFIPAQTAAGTVDYYVQARDTVNNAWHPAGAPTSFHSFQVTAISAGTGAIAGRVTDPTGAGINGVLLVVSPGGNTTTTAAAGDFTLAGLVPGTYSVTANLSGYQNATVTGVLVVSGQTAQVSLVLIPLQTLGVTAGTVTDKDGNPLQGVLVTLTPGGTTSTNPAGQFTFTNLNPGQYDLLANLTGYQDASLTAVSVQAGSTTYVNLILGIAQTVGVLGGTVTDTNGTLVAGALVELVGTGLNTTTLANGNFDFPNLAPGTYDVRASANGYFPALANGVVVTAGQRSSVGLVLRPTTSTTGNLQVIVTDFLGNALPGASVSILTTSLQGPTNSVGLVTFPGVTQGTYDVSVTLAGYQTATRTGISILPEATTTITVVLFATPPTTGSITVRVTDQNGQALPGASVSLDGGGGVPTDANGTTTFSGVAPGAHSLMVSASGFTAATSGLTVTAGETAGMFVALTPPTTGGATPADLGPWIAAVVLLIVGLLLGLFLGMFLKRRKGGEGLAVAGATVPGQSILQRETPAGPSEPAAEPEKKAEPSMMPAQPTTLPTTMPLEPAKPAVAEAAAPSDTERRLAKLKELTDRGLLSPEEYETKRKEALGETSAGSTAAQGDETTPKRKKRVLE
ncbi:MAG TPA: carboxypeptidase regulatory-like domain-containing protein [Thermoplasmata archaeon]|nr:carboxypeptidase regulatory-like domain-containing protein [Thermoplasmata archaeon]